MSLFRWIQRWEPHARARHYYSCANAHVNNQITLWDETIAPKGQKVKLTSRRPSVLTWYACGPTVYDSAHIGHASSYIRLDIIRRILEQHGYTVLQVMGVTDIDDKIISRAQLSNTAWMQLAQHYELEFFRDLDKMSIKAPHIKARVSQFIPQIINFVSKLLSSDFAYSTADGSVYFDRSKCPIPAVFRQSASLESLAEQEVKSDSILFKKNPRDFALWKGVKPGEPYWETPWGKGRPGWHIECSVIASHFFGSFLDIHSGGMDLTFPHHENEEIQCCAKFGQERWVSHWIHTGHLHLTGDVKMSKSIGNTVSMSEFLSKNSPDVLRMLCLIKKYYTNIEYNRETELHAKSLLQKIHTFIVDARAVLSGSKMISMKSGTSETDLWKELFISTVSIQNALIDNFDTPTAVLTLMELIGTFNSNVEEGLGNVATNSGIDLSLVLAMSNKVRDFCSIVGLGEQRDTSTETSLLLEPLMKHTLGFRSTVRSIALSKDNKGDQSFSKQGKELMGACDAFRKNLGTLGVEIKDHGQVSSWSVHNKQCSNE